MSLTPKRLRSRFRLKITLNLNLNLNLALEQGVHERRERAPFGEYDQEPQEKEHDNDRQEPPLLARHHESPQFLEEPHLDHSGLLFNLLLQPSPVPSILVFVTLFCLLTRLIPFFPIRSLLPAYPLIQHVIPQRPGDQPDRRDDGVEERRQDEAAHEEAEDHRKPHPELMRRL